MIVRHRLVEAERVKELPLTLVAPPHHRPPPSRIAPGRRNHSSTPAFNAFLQQNLPEADIAQVTQVADRCGRLCACRRALEAANAGGSAAVSTGLDAALEAALP